MSDKTTAEQRAKDMLERMEIEGAQSFSSGELVEIANLIADRDALADRCEKLREAAREDSDAYHRVMSLLSDLQLEHGRCEPRERRACTRCNASDDLAALVKAYRGPRVALAAPKDAP